jgi:hypothetical protein
MGSGESVLESGGFLVSIGERDLRLDGKSFGEWENVRSRDVDLITIRGFRFGMLERVDSLAWKGLDVRIIVRGGGGRKGVLRG